MKRMILIFAACLLGMSLACGAKTEPKAETPDVTVPETVELTLTLPLGTRDDVAKQFPAYRTGFAAKDGSALTFALSSADPTVAEGILKDDGTLCVIAHGVGETKLTVTAKTASGAENTATVSVAVRDARRTLALIVLGVLSVALLVLLGKPSAKKPEPPVIAQAAAQEPETPAVIFAQEEEKNENPERS